VRSSGTPCRSRACAWARCEPAFIDEDFTRIGTLKSRQQVKQRGLAASGRAEERYELARLDVEADPIDGMELAVRLHDAPNGNARSDDIPFAKRLPAMF
jgi:hypothetical protein